MFDTKTLLPKSIRVARPDQAAADLRRFPLEHAAEFAETQASAGSASLVATAISAGLLFHVLLVAERQFFGLHTHFFALRGLAVTVGLLGMLLIPGGLPQYRRGLACMVAWGSVIALVAGVPLGRPSVLLPVETGIAVLILVFGWLAQLPLGWTMALTGGMLAADAGSLLSTAGNSTALTLNSLFAPAFAVAFTWLSAQTRRDEARRNFLVTRAAAFAGTEKEEAPEDSRHLDPVTGVGNRAAFDMRLRASWELAVGRRNSVALLMFSIDDYTQKQRKYGQKYADMLQKQVAAMLKEGLRRSDDMVARFDAQHFVVLLPGVGTDGATQIAERLRGCVEELVVYAASERRRATVTVGVASLRAKRITPREKLVECATNALEQARENGPNSVCVEGRGCLPRMV